MKKSEQKCIFLEREQEESF